MSHPVPVRISIVTPAYNEEQHLPQCIESILAQTHTDWDYTIVNNHSTDGTEGIAQSYAARDPRIRVITNPRCEPAIRNFNIALGRISVESKYCKMVLADDWLYPECLSRMAALMEEYPTVGVVSAYGLADRHVLWTGLPYPSTFIRGRDIARQRLLGGPYVFGSQTTVLLRSDLIRRHTPFFNIANDHPDSEACLAILKECDFGFVHQVLTYTRKRSSGSLLSRSEKLNTLAASLLHELVTYGPYYLTPQEYSARFDAEVGGYFDFLARSLWERRDPEFWSYHKARLAENGVRVNSLRLAAAFAKLVGLTLLGRLRGPQKRKHWGLTDGSTAAPCQ